MDMKIAVLPGDGIGHEIVKQAVKVLEVFCESENINLTLNHRLIGGAAIDECGTPLPPKTVSACRAADAVLLGAVGGPQWDSLPGERRPERGILGIRAELSLFANLRPARIFEALKENSPLKDSIVGQGVDLLVVRELTGGIYFGRHGREDINGESSAFDEMRYSEHEIERIARVALSAAVKRHRHVTCVDKANVLESSRLFRETVKRVAEKDFPDVELDYMYVDNASMQLVKNPAQFDVIVTGNLFGDILSDEASMLTGSIGMLPSASLSASGFGLYEPIHGSAPDITGLGIANPLATILSVALMLKHTFGMSEQANLLEEVVEKSLEVMRTPDLLPNGQETGGIGRATTEQLGDFVAQEYKKALCK